MLAWGEQVAAGAARCHSPSDANALRTAHLEMLNKVRKRRELTPFKRNELLDEVAQSYACLMAQTGHFDHVGPNGTTLSQRIREGGYSFCLAAENIAFGQQSLTQVMKGWINSPGHWKNIINRDLREIGFGAAFVTDGAEHHSDGAVSSLTQLAKRLETNATDVAVPKTGIYWVQVFGTPCIE